MKQILVISGKGGTGKTVITGAFAALADNKVLADCDVDAADLHLLLEPSIRTREEFRSGKTAVIDPELCVGCGKCVQVCRFGAVGSDFVVDPISCEGCAFCSFACSFHAVHMEENVSGEWFVSDTRFGPMVHARLGIAEENSGKLVSLVKKKAKELGDASGADYIIIDGPPGTGCPVISSLSGVDCAVIVAEPTLSGLHDAGRVLELAGHFKVPAGMIINKFDLNIDMTEKIEEYCAERGAEMFGRIRFDKSVVNAMVNGRTVMEGGSARAQKEITKIWESIVSS